MARFDTAVVNGTAVLPGHGAIRADIGIKDGRIVAICDSIPASEAEEVIDARGHLVLPGAVDAHFHLGIYRDIAEDARSETASSLAGGVTSVISYFRTGSHYLEKSGPYAEIFPEVLERTSGNSWVDYGYHLAPMVRDQIREIERLVNEDGVASFKYYMFYKGMDLAGQPGESETMSEVYDLGHMFEIMEEVARLQASRTDGSRISLSIHCEQPELIRVFMERVQSEGVLEGLEAYSAARPPLTEHLAVAEVGVLAGHTRCPVNLLHLSSEEALEAALELKRQHPSLDARLETTLHHLALTYETYNDQRGKVNPPIRAQSDVEALWRGVLRGEIDWVCSDHACCSEEHKEGELWRALPGFGGTALIYPFMLTEGRRRGLSLERIVGLVATNPARAYGLAPRKGAITIGADADLAIVDVEQTHAVTPERLLSAQEYTPFEGMELAGWPVRTLLRGRTAFAGGETVGEPAGSYLKRPLMAEPIPAS
ncbi:D-hydantoinase [Rubrobacter xylanophilus DSM 9941]|uniref:dihydroorotase n=1 Tax=Rubrobacter xylanophilus TaxID=49319 RepID=UPI001C6407B0|nr:dihydroorotase family protein [Rubrobacter xylanophilus]QYJ16583.1 D-hydantoinase [Rubrobacter xylanophilus DSM 9941]